MIGKSDDTGELFNVRKIVKNKIRCKKCGDIIESVYKAMLIKVR